MDAVKGSIRLLIGEEPVELLSLSKREVNSDNLLLLLHTIILVANEVGAPLGDQVSWGDDHTSEGES